MVHSRTIVSPRYEVVRGALDADDTLKARGEEIRFRVRETAEWKKHAADLEMEMIKRGMIFEVINWSQGQAGSTELRLGIIASTRYSAAWS